MISYIKAEIMLLLANFKMFMSSLNLFCSKAKFRGARKGLIARFAWCGWLYIYPSTNKYKEKKEEKTYVMSHAARKLIHSGLVLHLPSLEPT